VDRDASTVSHHLSRLEADGLVERERDGPAVVNRLAPATRAALERVEASPVDPEDARARAD
jgi:DNA-binding transcriptional ArsR family regulator